LLGLTLVAGKFHPCAKDPYDLKKDVILDKEKAPENKYPPDTLPNSMDWRWSNGQRWVTWTRNQHAPNYCGSCWAQATTSALADRIMIQNNDQFPEWSLAPQVLLNCDFDNDGCHGGNANKALHFIMQHGIPAETCQPYEATGWDTGNVCQAITVCKNCSPGQGNCWAQSPYQVWNVTEIGTIQNNITQMMQALQEGPIICYMGVTEQFENYQGFGIFHDTTGDTSLDHVISLVGYGTQDGTDYWIGRNSWGTFWGDNGYFRIVKGVNNLGIEELCNWARPAAEPMLVNATNYTGIPVETRPTSQSSPEPKKGEKRTGTCRVCNDWNAIGGAKILSPLPQEYIDAQSLPTDYFWGNINGLNLLTVPRNQHIPQYCGSCWAFGTTSSISDRFNIIRYQKGQSLWPGINLSPQVIINENAGGNCNGGMPIAVYQYAHRSGVPHETCQLYQAKNDPHGTNTELNICETCSPGNTSETLWPGTCAQVTNHTLYYVGEYGPVVGAAAMKQEIFARGPISCGVDATAEFETYTGGIYSQNLTEVNINHEIAVVGWGYDTTSNMEYWIGRNSWGMYWGEEGFFQIEMYQNNLGIETDCSWGVPTWEKP